MKKSFLYYFAIILIVSFCLAGCTSSDVKKSDNNSDAGAVLNEDETTISIDKKGKIEEIIVETFDKSYYDVGELETEFRNEIDRFNSSGTGGKVSLKKIKLENNKVYVSLDFDSMEEYKGLLNEDLFCGTIKDAYDIGYKMDVTLKGVQNGDKIGKVEIMGMQNKNIVILSEPVKVSLYKNIAYVSANVEVISDKEARVLSESGGLAYIVLE